MFQHRPQRIFPQSNSQTMAQNSLRLDKIEMKFFIFFFIELYKILLGCFFYFISLLEQQDKYKGNAVEDEKCKYIEDMNKNLIL